MVIFCSFVNYATTKCANSCRTPLEAVARCARSFLVRPRASGASRSSHKSSDFTVYNMLWAYVEELRGYIHSFRTLWQPYLRSIHNFDCCTSL